MGHSGEIFRTNMIKLVALSLIGYASAGLVHYPNGAVVPFDPYNQAATAAHLATRGYGHYWKREAEADADAGLIAGGLVSYSNGAVVPLTPTTRLPPLPTLPPVGMATTGSVRLKLMLVSSLLLPSTTMALPLPPPS